MQRIFVPLDGSELAQRAVPVAASLARGNGSELVLMHAHWPGLPGSGSDGHLRKTAWALREQGLKADIRTRVTPRDAETSRIILDSAEECSADVLVVGTHGRSGLGRFLYGSVAEQLLQASRIPVLLVPASLPRRWPEHAPASVILALDESPDSEHAIEPTVAIADALGADLVLLRVISAADPLSESALQELSGAERYLRRLSERLTVTGRPVRHDIRFGDPDRAILELARELNALAVGIGMSGKGRRRGASLGRVALETLRRTEVPVLLVPPENRVAVLPLELLVSSSPLRPSTVRSIAS